MCLKGPDFLCLPEGQWPEQPDFVSNGVEPIDPEIRQVKISSVHLKKPEPDSLSRLLRRYSKFIDLQTSVAWLLRFKSYIQQRRNYNFNSKILSAEERSKATVEILRLTQKESFSEALVVLYNHPNFDSTFVSITEQQLKTNLSLRELQHLDPYVVDGILRVGGRLQNSNLPLETKHPILLPSQHHVTDLLILLYHSVEGHLGCLHVLNALNKKYWIMKGKTTVKKALRKCMNCRFWKAKEGRQKIANLPVQRVTPSTPLTATGTNLMGPVLIKIDRNMVKRYVTIFNC